MSESCSLPRIFNAARHETFEAKNVQNDNVEVGTKRFVIELELHAAWRRFNLTNRTHKKKIFREDLKTGLFRSIHLRGSFGTNQQLLFVPTEGG